MGDGSGQTDTLARFPDTPGQFANERAEALELDTAWRKEVTHGGKYWQWRERKHKGKTRYGGKFADLSEARQAEYQENRRIHHARRSGRTTRQRAEVLPAGGLAGDRLQRDERAEIVR